MTLRDRFHNLAETLHPQWVALRRHLHAHPELSFEEHETMAFVGKTLTEWGIEHTTGVTGTGIVAHLQGQEPDSRLVALRADMDALPIQEANEVPYASKRPGIMHACGHDVHTTSLLGAMQLLKETQTEWKGTIRCIFQPGEERIPGGAKGMVAAGVLQNPTPGHILGQHVYPQLPAGHVGVRPGAYMAAADELHLTVHGKGGHAALPHLCRDAVLAASGIVVAAQQLVARRSKPTEPVVCSFGFVEALGATNVLPDEVHLKGTFRSLDPAVRAELHDALTTLVQDTASAHGCKAELEIRHGYPSVRNDESLAHSFREVAEAYLGKEKVHSLDIRMTGEDFSYFSNEIPGCFYRLGTASPEEGNPLGTKGLHTPLFDVDENALKTGAGLMAFAAVRTTRKQ